MKTVEIINQNTHITIIHNKTKTLLILKKEQCKMQLKTPLHTIRTTQGKKILGLNRIIGSKETDKTINHGKQTWKKFEKP
jgi:hypothetical protein